MRLLTAISVASLVVSIAAVVLVLGLYAELDKSGSDTPTSDVPLLDEKTVKNLTAGFLYGNRDVEWRYKECSMASDTTTNINAQYVGKDIWVVVIEPLPTTCTFTVHDKEAHVILSREAMTTD